MEWLLVAVFDKYILSGVVSNAAWDLIKTLYTKITQQSWRDLYRRAFQEALDDLKPNLLKYVEGGEVSIDNEALSAALQQDLVADIGSMSLSQLSDVDFSTQLAEVLEAKSVLVIGGHNLSREDYAQLIRTFIKLVEIKFKAAIISDEQAFKRALLAEATDNQALLQEVHRLLADEFDLVLNKLDAISAKVERQHSQDVFLSLGEFRASLERTSNRLPYAQEFIGREPDIEIAVRSIDKGVRVLVIDGDPGIGKTRFCLELIEKLMSQSAFGMHEPRCVKEVPNDLWVALQAELMVSKQYILFIDDANRIDQLAIFRKLLIDPNRVEGSIIVASTRSYNSDIVVAKLREGGFDGVGRQKLARLSNADIDNILQAEPFNFDRVIRQRIVVAAKGNPRIASVAAAATIQGKDISENSFLNLFGAYFDSVFDDLREFLENRPKHKFLLTIIAALKYINSDDQNFVEWLTQYIGFSSVREFRDAITYLQSVEILDVFPTSHIVRVFEDNIAEYLVFRFCFDDKTGQFDFEEEIIEPLVNAFSLRVFENLSALIKKGYVSNKLKSLLTHLPIQAQKILLGDTDDKLKLTVLQQMQTYAISAPSDCFYVIEEYTRRRTINDIPDDQAYAIIDIAYRIMGRDWRHLLIPVATLLRDYALSSRNFSEKPRAEAIKNLNKLFDYIARPISDDRIQFIYEPHKLLVDEVEKWLSTEIEETTIMLYAELLGNLCNNHIEINEMDYVDPNRFNMFATSLAVNTFLHDIRSKAYRLLESIYTNQDISSRAKYKILQVYKKPFNRFLPFGGHPSSGLMKSDAEELLPIFERLAATETHLALLAHFGNLLRLIEKQLADGQAANLCQNLETERVILYQKFFGSFWDEQRHNGIDYDLVQKNEGEFIAQLGLNYIPEQALQLVELLSNLSESSLLEDRPNNWLMSAYFHSLGSRQDSALGESVLSLISVSNHPLFMYSNTLLASLSTRDLTIRQRFAEQWLLSGELTKARALAASYSFRQKSDDKNDLIILEKLLALNDEMIDWSLFESAFLCVESIEPNRVAQNLLVIACRLAPGAYSELLGRILPSPSYPNLHYQIYKSAPDIFAQIVSLSAKHEDYSGPMYSFNLTACLTLLSVHDTSYLRSYLKERLEYCADIEHRYIYAALPDDLDLRFIKELNDYAEFLVWLLQLKQSLPDKARHFADDVFKCVLAGSTITLDDEPISEFDPVTFKVFSEWIHGEHQQLEIILEIMDEVHPWQSWFGLVRHLVQQKDFPLDRDHLMSVLYVGSHSGPTSLYYKSRLQLVHGQQRSGDSPEMRSFLNYVEHKLEQMIQREEEREKMNAELGIEW